MSLPRIQLPGGLSCSVLGFGTMGFGGKFERDDRNDANAIKIIHRAIELGINLFDTAEVYGAGHSEEILGAALQGRRKDMVIATKFSPENSHKQAMITACEASLKRLRTDVIDLYQTHWPNPAVPLEETAAGFQHLVQSGKVRAIGFCNATAVLMRKITALLPLEFPIASSQQEYNLAERFVERTVLSFCQERKMALLAYSPLGQGNLVDGEGPDMLATIATEYKTTPTALALQWLMQQRGVIPIPMTSNIKHLEENATVLTNPPNPEAVTKAGKAFAKKIMEIPVTNIRVVSSFTGTAYMNLADARANTLNLSPSPQELARELADGEMLKPVKLRPKAGEKDVYELYEGQLRYWAWRLAHDDKLPIPALVS